jgi:hypothetical protein
MGLFDNLPNPAAPALAFQHGMRQGQAEREEREVRGALSAYAVNPDDPQAFERLAQWRPDMAIQVREQQDQRRQAAQVAELTRRAASGDQQALTELAPIDLDAWSKLNTQQRAQVKAGVDYAGQAYLAISKLPPEQRAAAWDQYAQRGVEQGFAELADEVGNYSEEALQAGLAEAGLVRQWIEMNEPRYQAIPEGGTLVNTADPSAVQAFTSGQTADLPTVASPEEARNLPPGSEFRTPDGRVLRVPGGGASNGVGGFLGQ